MKTYYESTFWDRVAIMPPDLQQKDRIKYTCRPFYRLQNLFSVWADHMQRCFPADGKQMKNRSAHHLAVKSVESARRRCATNADCRLADLQTCRPADLQTRRFADLHFLWQGFALFTVGESQSMSEANNSASGLQAKHCSIRQVTGNPCHGRLNIGRTVT